MKIAALHRAFINSGKIISKIVHTGQHFDANMSEIVWQQLELPQPDYLLNINQGSANEQTAQIMLALEPIFIAEKPHLIVVVGDVNSTLAGALTASKLNIKLAHVEAGLRSFDRTMPEEINRILTDQLADFLFVTEKSAIKNLKKEQINVEKIFFTGNCMIDSLKYFLNQADKINLDYLFERGVGKRNFILMTIHRPSNVDNFDNLKRCLDLIKIASEYKKVIIPLHPRTRKNLEQFQLLETLQQFDNVLIMPPLGYLDFIALLKNALIVISDSGGVQEETTFLKIPCLTLRDNTERPETTKIGTNLLVKNLDITFFESALKKLLFQPNIKGKTPQLWDGAAAERITKCILTNI